MDRRARPCATLALLPTAQTTAASSWSSRETSEHGSRWPARTNGRVVAANEDSERGRKVEKVERRGECARYDSSPLLNANEPIGSWESDRRRR